MPEYGFAVSSQNTVDYQKIQDMLKKCNVQILVGFPSGRQHISTKHEGEDGEEAYKNQDEPIETAELAEQLSYGTANIPARPFLDIGLEEAKEKLNAAIEKELKKIETGQEPNWDKIGTMAVGSVQELVRSDYFKTRVPNSDRTIRIKGSDTPLIDGGDLINSLTYIVEKK